MSQRRSTFIVGVGLFLLISLQSWSQVGEADNPYLMRIERQTHDENVCMLVQKDGRYRLERIISGRPRVFEGVLDLAAIRELEPLLNADQLTSLKQSQIESILVSEDMDAVIIAILRPTGWQSLNFPSGKSRKSYRASMDPLMKWLDRNKQQQNPIVGATPNRCIPPQSQSNDTSRSNSNNSYLMRLVADHYEPVLSGNTQPETHYANFKVIRQCTIVYSNGRYRMERSVQQFNSEVRSEIYRDNLDKAQLDDLRKLLDNPQLASLPNHAAPSAFAREGDLVVLAIPREKSIQQLSFASFFGTRTKEQGMKDNLGLSVDANVELTHPLRKWIKQNIDERKSAQVKDVPSSACLPSNQPE